MTMLERLRGLAGRVTGRSESNGNGHVEIDEHFIAVYPDNEGNPDVGAGPPPYPLPPQHPSAPSGGGAHPGPGGVHIPAGGAPGDVLSKASAADEDTAWLPPGASSLPPGGAAADVLTKRSATDADAGWLPVPPTPPELPAGGVNNDVLTKTGAAPSNVIWRAPAPAMPAGGVAQDVLTKQSATAGDALWAPPVTELPTGGLLNEVLTKTGPLDTEVDWLAAPSGLPLGGLTREVLTKQSDTDLDAIWQPPQIIWTWRGEWAAATTYAAYDAVSYLGSSYYAPTGPAVGVAPPAAPWVLIAQAGVDGTPSVIIGSFGSSKTPADLPVDGAIPVDWDAPGNPQAAHQMLLGEALLYIPADHEDIIYGHLYTYVTTAPPSGTPSGWVDGGRIAGPGEPGEVEIGPTDPYTADPLSSSELWYDTSAIPGTLKARNAGAWETVSTPLSDTVVNEANFELPTAPGVALTASRGDHSHGTPRSEVAVGDTEPTTPKDLWVNTGVTPHELMAYVGSAYVPVGATTSEVEVTPTDPYVTDPASTAQLWFHTAANERVLYVREGTDWVLVTPAFGSPMPHLSFGMSSSPGVAEEASRADHSHGTPDEPTGAASEVEVAAVDPYVTDAASEAELWHDTSSTPGVLKARVNGAWEPAVGGLKWRGAWNASLVYLPLDAVSYDNPIATADIAVGVSSYECLADTFIGAAPPPTDPTRWRLIVEVGPAGPEGPEGPQGAPGLNWLGTWDAAADYVVDDAVSHMVTTGQTIGVSSFRCVADVAAGGAPPDANAAWQLIAQAGEMGQATVIVGDFGQSKSPADLPPDGLLPQDWDAVGNPLAETQMEVGQSLFYAPTAGPSDPLDGHMFQYVSVAFDPSGWLDIGIIKGPPGITWRGVWSDSTAYDTNDGVSYDNPTATPGAGTGVSSWRCTTPSFAGAPPPPNDITRWVLLAEAGADAKSNGTTELWVGPDEPPVTAPPDLPIELWYDTDAVPQVPTHGIRAMWVDSVDYTPGAQVLWPPEGVDIYMAQRDTINEEPGQRGINDGIDFNDRGAAPAAPQGFSAAVSTVTYADGVDIRYHTGGYDWLASPQWLGGYLVTATNAGNIPVYALATVTDGVDHTLDLVRLIVLNTSAVHVLYDVPFSEFATAARPWLRATIDTATGELHLYDGVDGVNWTERGPGFTSPDPLLTNGVTALHIGHDNDEPTHNWGGPQSEIETFNLGGQLQTSWVAYTQPSNPTGPNYPDPPPDPVPTPGVGASPRTGEDYQGVGGVIPVWLIDRYPAWTNVSGTVHWTSDATYEGTQSPDGSGISFAGGAHLFKPKGAADIRLNNGTVQSGMILTTANIVNASGMRQQDGLAITAGSYYWCNVIMNSGGATVIRLFVTAKTGNNIQVFETISNSNINASPDQGVSAQIGTPLVWGTKMFDRVGCYMHSQGARLKIRACWTGTIDIGWTCQDPLNAHASVGGSAWSLDTVGGGEVGAVAL